MKSKHKKVSDIHSSEEFRKFVINEFTGIRELKVVIIKGHILIEYLLSYYLELLSNDGWNRFLDGSTFHNKVRLLETFGDKNFKKFVNLILKYNRIRNDISHYYEWDIIHLDEFIDELVLMNEPIVKKNKDASKMIISSIIYICSFIWTTIQLQKKTTQ